MSQFSELQGSGFLTVLTQPISSEVLEEYHEWYNTEHGPLRMQLDFISTGCHYQSRDLSPPVWLAAYDIDRLSGLSELQYTVLRENRSQRESSFMDHKLLYVIRRIYKGISSRGHSKEPAPVLMTVTFVVKDALVDEMHHWYEEEHIKDLSKIPGWRRSRRFELIEADDLKTGYTELLAMHEFDCDNGIDGPEHAFAKSRPWRNRMLGLVESRDNKRFDFYHEFKASNYREPAELKTRTVLRGPSDWHLEGPVDGPVIVFSNSLLTTHHIWDSVIEELKIHFPSHRYLVYNTRGYSSDPKCEVNIDMLADDLIQLLDYLGISKCRSVIGVSLGGVTTLNLATRYPTRLDSFVACDCNFASTESNTKAWQARVKLGVESWEQLADQTVQRWFSKDFMSAQPSRLSIIKDMILAANDQGFARCVEALCNFDLREAIQRISVPGLCVVGSEDGVLPSAMALVSQTIPKCHFTAIAGSGHLPMVEDPQQFVASIIDILRCDE